MTLFEACIFSNRRPFRGLSRIDHPIGMGFGLIPKRAMQNAKPPILSNPSRRELEYSGRAERAERNQWNCDSSGLEVHLMECASFRLVAPVETWKKDKNADTPPLA